jgi:hypothetical protein
LLLAIVTELANARSIPVNPETGSAARWLAEALQTGFIPPVSVPEHVGLPVLRMTLPHRVPAATESSANKMSGPVASIFPKPRLLPRFKRTNFRSFRLYLLEFTDSNEEYTCGFLGHYAQNLSVFSRNVY